MASGKIVGGSHTVDQSDDAIDRRDPGSSGWTFCDRPTEYLLVFILHYLQLEWTRSYRFTVRYFRIGSLYGLLVAFTLVCMSLPSATLALSPDDYFRIKVVDAETGRGVPLVKLETVNNITFYTDSAGVAAIYEPGLMSKNVWFSVDSHGYEFSGPARNGGIKLRLRPGETKTIKIQPQNVAKRLYRVTGFGIYGNSEETNPPIKNPFFNTGGVTGQDSINTAVFRNKIYWLWDDTQTLLGNTRRWHSRGTGATSTLPSKGGLDPKKGVNLNYFVREDDRAARIFPSSIASWVWLFNLMVIKDESDREQMFASYFTPKERQTGIARWDDENKKFENIVKFQGKKDNLAGRTFKVRTEGQEWFYFATPYPVFRVPATREAITNLDRYEAFTPFEQGSEFPDGSIERDKKGDPVWGWKANTPSLHSAFRRLRLNWMDKLDAPNNVFHLRDVNGNRSILAQRGTVYWNEYRKKWVMVIGEVFGKFSFLGDLWYAEADSPVGPWVYARRIIRHENYACYNPRHHKMFDQHNGQRILLECTYSDWASFGSGTPRYNYNQILYQLDLSDTRLNIPSPVYQYKDDNDAYRYHTVKKLDSDTVARKAPIPFYAPEPDRPRPGTVPVWETQAGLDTVKLTLRKPPSGRDGGEDAPNFYAYPPDADISNPNLVDVYEFKHRSSGQFLYSPTDPGSDWIQTRVALQAWKSPNKNPPRAPGAKPVKTCMGASAYCD